MEGPLLHVTFSRSITQKQTAADLQIRQNAHAVDSVHQINVALQPGLSTQWLAGVGG